MNPFYTWGNRMNGNSLIVRLWINDECILDICESLGRVHSILDPFVLSKIRELENKYQGRARQTILIMS